MLKCDVLVDLLLASIPPFQCRPLSTYWVQLASFSVLQAIGSWRGPKNKAISNFFPSSFLLPSLSSPSPSPLFSFSFSSLPLPLPSSQADRRHHSRVHELQERLDQANSTKRSMENYVNFLKSSYASIFNDSGNPTSPHSTLLHWIYKLLESAQPTYVTLHTPQYTLHFSIVQFYLLVSHAAPVWWFATFIFGSF